MDKTLLKKSWILAGLLLVTNIVLGLLILTIVEFFKIGSPGISGIAGIIGAMFVGQIYTVIFKEIMPKKLKINVTVVYILTQIVLGSLLYIFVLDVPNYLLFFGILVGFSLLYSLLIYWMLGSGGKAYLKALQKREAIKK